MRLLTKTTLYFSLLLAPLMAGAGFVLYKQLNQQLEHETDEELDNDSRYWRRYLASPDLDPAVLNIHTQPFDIQPADPGERHRHFGKAYDVMLFQEVDDEDVPFRERKELVTVQGKDYVLTLRRSLLEKEDWFSNISLAMAFIFMALLGSILLLNWALSRRMWRPFYRTLESMQHLQLDQLSQLDLSPSNTQEFRRLNNALSQMTARIHRDYQAMKSLTEDAAHEMQTPLAIAQQQLELFMQDPSLTAHQGQAVLQTSDALQRLSRLTHNLLFLAKIENHQFATETTISLETVIKKYVQLFDLQLQERQITVQLNIDTPRALPLHPVLADTLVSNLLGNAIKYNQQNGRIIITLDAHHLSVQNTSELPALPVTNQFERFKKYHAYAQDSNGLGLAIVARICEAQGWKFGYGYDGGLHCFEVKY